MKTNELMDFAKGHKPNFKPVYVVVARGENGEVKVLRSRLGGYNGRDCIVKIVGFGEEDFWKNFNNSEFLDKFRNELTDEKEELKT